MAATKDYFGKKFGHLLAIKPTSFRSRQGSVIWTFICDCGKRTNHVAYRVARGDIKSCGCSRNTKDEHFSGLKNMYQDYKAAAWSKGRSFKLTLKKFIEITQQNCYYCGVEPESRTRKFNFKANGLDRVNNDRGYTKDNVVPCCMICNRAKGFMSFNDFKNWIERIKKYDNTSNA